MAEKRRGDKSKNTFLTNKYFDMLPSSTTKVKNAVEEVFCVPFGNLPQQPMDKDTEDLMLRLYMASMHGSMGEIPEKEKPFIIKMTESSLKNRFTFKIEDNALIAFIAFNSKTAGNVIMYLTYLQYKCKKNNMKVLDFKTFCHWFPMGFPSDADLEKVWDSQKVERKETGDSDNLLDYQSAMESIHFKN